jgi:hypothetical protein
LIVGVAFLCSFAAELSWLLLKAKHVSGAPQHQERTPEQTHNIGVSQSGEGRLI